MWLIILRSWQLCTRLCPTITCIWRELCWNPTWSQPDTPAQRSTPPRMLPLPPWPLSGALSLLLFLVSFQFLPSSKSLKRDFFFNEQVWCNFSLLFQASASCLEARVRRRPPSTWTPSTRCPSNAPGSWPSLTAVHSRPPLSLPGKAKLPTRLPHRRFSATGPRWASRWMSGFDWCWVDMIKLFTLIDSSPCTVDRTGYLIILILPYPTLHGLVNDSFLKAFCVSTCDIAWCGICSLADH